MALSISLWYSVPPSVPELSNGSENVVIENPDVLENAIDNLENELN